MPHIGNFPEKGYPRPLAIPPAAFVAYEDSEDWTVESTSLSNRVIVAAQTFWAPVSLPHGATVEKLTLYAYLSSLADQVNLKLYRNDRAGTSVEMASVVISLPAGYSSAYDASITNPVIDNENYDYALEVTLTPDFQPTDARLTGALIHWK